MSEPSLIEGLCVEYSNPREQVGSLLTEDIISLFPLSTLSVSDNKEQLRDPEFKRTVGVLYP